MISTEEGNIKGKPKQQTVSNPLEHIVSCDLQVDIVCDFVKAYEKEKYRAMREGGNLKSVCIFMAEYCENIRGKSN